MTVTNLLRPELATQNFLCPNFDAILPELKAIPNWVLTKAVMRDGKLTKPPYQPNGMPASHSNPATWSTFEEVRSAYERGGFIGVGFVLDGEPHFNGKYLYGFDYDHCVIDNKFEGNIGEVVKSLRLSRVEASISNTGIRGFFLHNELLQSRRTVIDGRSVELYSAKRYLTTTGIGIGDLSRPANIDAILGLFPEKSAKASVPTTPSNSTLEQVTANQDTVEKIADGVKHKKPALWAGHWQKLEGDPFGLGYPSQSDADLALAGAIARACVGEGISHKSLAGTVESVFGLSALAQREKWKNREDYRVRTINKALEGVECDEDTQVHPDNKLSCVSELHGDMRNAKVFALLWRRKLVFVANAGKWLRWTDQSWSWCYKEEETAYAKVAVEALMRQAQKKFRKDPDKGKRWMQHATNSHNLPRIQAMLKLAISEPGMAATINELDSDPWLLGIRNGVVDLRTGELMPNTPDLYITRYCNASYDAGAVCPQWLNFLDQVFEGDNETIETIQRALGYTLTGSVTEEQIFICFGFGSNGKSVFNNLIAHILGDYGRVAPSTILTVRRSDDTGARNDLAALAGSRYVSINELQAGDRLDEQVVKQLAGREMISARFLHKEFFEFMPTFKPWLRTNHKPIITGDDDGIWRRLVLIPFRRKFTEKERDLNLEQKLLGERDGILMWMLEGAQIWRKDGLKLSGKIKAEHASYRTESDLLGEFLDERCQVGVNDRVEQTQLFDQWRFWCNTNGVKHNAKASFTRRLAERGFKESKSNGKRFYSGLSIDSTSPTLVPQGKQGGFDSKFR